MIPILYEKDETKFTSNGLGRLRDCISCTVTEERNSIYEADFEYPVTGAHYEDIRVGRIIGVTHDDTGDIQPFDIVSYERPIDGIVTFHCTHISYRLNYYTVVSSRTINSLADAIQTIQAYAKPTMPFRIGRISTWSPTGLCAAFDGLPHSARSLLGGMEGSVLDAYGGEYMWDKWSVLIQPQRGTVRDFVIRYGVNMTGFEEQYDTEGTYSACIPYWTDGTDKVIGDRQTGNAATVTGRGETAPLDVSDKFESKPTKAQVNAEGLRVLNANKPALPVQNITVEFVRLQEENAMLTSLMECRLCDTIRVVFPDQNASGDFKIVKTVWNALRDRYEEMELGQLGATLSQALGISSGNGPMADPLAGNVTIGGNLTVNGTASIIGLLSPAAISAGLFSVSEHTASLSGTAAGNRTTTASATKSGYFPLGVVGELVSSSGAYSRGIYLTNRTQGSATVNFRIYATGSGAKDCTAYVLWVKNTA